VVWAIRKFQPDVIINRFDHRTAGTRTVITSAILSTSFNLANDPASFRSIKISGNLATKTFLILLGGFMVAKKI
jgi:hypothetical protein